MSYEVLTWSRKHVSVERGKIVELYETYLGISWSKIIILPRTTRSVVVIMCPTLPTHLWCFVDVHDHL